jgi:hypothetical protein
MTAFLLMAAFAVDIANAYANSRQLSVAADAAALSASAKVGEAYAAQFPNAACDPAKLTSMNAAQIAQTEADRVNTANNKTGLSEPVGPVTVTCQNDNKSIQVLIANSRAVKTQLAGIIGIDSIRPNSYAVGRYQKSSVGGGLRPWAVCDTTVVQARDHPDQTYWTPLGNWSSHDGDVGVCGSSAPGNWGSVDFDDGGNSAGDLAAWTLNGYPGSVTIPDPALPADPGVSNSSQLVDAFKYLVGKIVLFPSVKNISGAGQNAIFNAAGVATLKICGIYYANNAYNIDQTTGLQSDCWQDPTPATTSMPTVTQVTAASMADGDNVVTTTIAGQFDPGMVGGAISVPNAGNNSGTSPLTGTISSVAADGLSVTLGNGDKAKHPVAGVAATVNWTKVTTVPGTLNVPLDNSGKVIDHIQFRWVNYTTDYSGPGGTVCQLSDPQCVGTTVLWK